MTASDEDELYAEVLQRFAETVNTLCLETIKELADRLPLRNVIARLPLRNVIATIVDALIMEACLLAANMQINRADFDKLLDDCVANAKARLAAMDAPKQ
jgi:hypothetical protein